MEYVLQHQEKRHLTQEACAKVINATVISQEHANNNNDNNNINYFSVTYSNEYMCWFRWVGTSNLTYDFLYELIPLYNLLVNDEDVIRKRVKIFNYDLLFTTVNNVV